MLRAMYSGDGRFHFEESKKAIYKEGERKGQGKRKYKVMYSTSSEQLAKDVRDLLLRFGIIASIYEFDSYYKVDGERRAEGPSWRVEISDAKQIAKFIKEIGFIGQKQKIALEHLPYLEQLDDNPNSDTIPAAIWGLLDKKFAEYGRSRTGCRRHYRRGIHEKLKKDLGHCGNIGKDMSRSTLQKIAEYLDNDAELMAIAESDIYWDEVVSIEPVGLHQTYDLAMPNDHNFVCNNIVTHNSTMMLNVAMNIWLEAKKSVLFCPLEMPREYIEDKMVSRALKIPFEFLQNPKSLSDDQVTQIEQLRSSGWQVDGAKFYIMDSKEGRVKPSTIKNAINQHKEVFKPDCVVIDYIGNMVPDVPRNGRQDIEIGDILKELYHMGKKGVLHENGFGVISGAQIGREALRRVRRAPGDKITFNSEDIRGAHDFAADATTIYALFADPQAPGERLFTIVVKSRYGKKQFPDGNYQATLNVRPDISLITSASHYFTSSSDDPNDVLMKLAEQEDDFDSATTATGTKIPAAKLDDVEDNDDVFSNW
ncbi:MAG: hypothetical protein HC888_02385 [Candidatus Competibacteraceae bacterium]|nr:hypothetical protein [Candidatus Competibacteraceae bacterium]